eukprot:5531627-Pyramimonas_sp.AAC.1
MDFVRMYKVDTMFISDVLQPAWASAGQCTYLAMEEYTLVTVGTVGFSLSREVFVQWATDGQQRDHEGDRWLSLRFRWQ